MMSIPTNLQEIHKSLPETARLVAVSKFHTVENIVEAYQAGQRIFGESRAQEFEEKYKQLAPIAKDIQWHFIGHLQRNKVKFIVPYVAMIHSLDSLRLYRTINREAEKIGRIVPCLLQLHIADEHTKYGFTFEECRALLHSGKWKDFKNVHLSGVMGMATLTDNQELVRKEFKTLKNFFDEVKETYFADDPCFKEISMGMSQDYPIAVEEGSTLIRVGSKIFGERAY